uniref:Mu-theraphotoxin-Hhn1d n=1 Tax=Cyriopagopus hainanus TaxID=2781057 RepID=H4C01_CYRHA|nr:RecName: Full=Mu-theraphotoxin-Hhn1d; Short=Mu-TRTX-Hhn1d; AltName: Full=Hainantoxin-IV-3; Short=HNTX-IV-3; Flags: Precursor [Haplopelma hainanum]ADB56728.1 HNTX-IV-3 precursor [Haplopelma hainanum]
MKASMFLALAGLALLFVVCYASESEEKEFSNELLSSVLAVDDNSKGEERECLGFGKGCNPSSDQCCKSSNLVCSRKHRWCKYEIGK